MVEPKVRNAHVFLVHVWIEPDPNGRHSPRGYVEYIQTRERRYFSRLDEALAFVDALVAGENADAPAAGHTAFRFAGGDDFSS